MHPSTYTPPQPPALPAPTRRRSFGILSPRLAAHRCLSSFAAGLVAGLEAGGDSAGVIRYEPGGDVAALLVDEPPEGALDGWAVDPAEARALLGAFDIAVVQHDWATADAAGTADVVEIVNGLDRPVIVVLHTDLREPTDAQRATLRQLAARARAIVATTTAGRLQLCEDDVLAPGRLVSIPRGSTTTLSESADWRRTSTRPELVSWGAFGAESGIDVVIEALCQLRDLRPAPRFLVADQPTAAAATDAAEDRRDRLVRRSWEVGVAPMISFETIGDDDESVGALLRSADIAVIPHHDQTTVMAAMVIDAIAAGRPVIATDFPQAVELLAGGAGTVVPERDPGALADALRNVLTVPGLAASMTRQARRLAPELTWPSVAGRYAQLAELVAVGPSVAE